MGVHLAGIFIAGVGLAWLLGHAYDAVRAFAPRRSFAAAGVACVALPIAALAPAWTERASYDRHGDALMRVQEAADAAEGRDVDRLVAIVKDRGGGRVYAGLRGNWGGQYVVGYVPLHAWLADRDVDAIGFTFRTIASLSTDVEAAFDETNPADYQMLNVRYLILPADRKPSVPATLVISSGRHRLWEVKTSGYVQVVDRSAAISADRADMATAMRGFMGSDLASRGIYPGVAFAGAAGSPPTFTGATPPHGPAGTVVAQTQFLENGVFTATVDAKRRAVVLLKASFDPRWTATVDGRRVQPTMMAPSLVGVDVPAGEHGVRFEYEPYARYPLLLILGAITLLGLTLVPRGAALTRLLRSCVAPRPKVAGVQESAAVERRAG
jgi:hypothetical protein